MTALSITRIGEFLTGKFFPNTPIKGRLNLSGKNLTELPAGLEVDTLDLSGCTNLKSLPEGLKVKRLILNGCSALEYLPAGLSCYELELRHTTLASLPTDLRVEYRLDLEGNKYLTELPDDLKVGTLILRNCTALTRLPEGLSTYFLDISGCTSLTDWPKRADIRIGRILARNCTGLKKLPEWLTQLSQLDLRGCINLTELPDNLEISSWLELADTQLKALPASLKAAALLWRGIPVDARIVLHPETITVPEVLDERNVEKRRVLLERVGYEKFMKEAAATVLDRDKDPGGVRELLMVPIPEDEPLVCLSVRCPSTDHQYLLRVPPAIKGCHQAAAWLAGFDNPADYHPLAET